MLVGEVASRAAAMLRAGTYPTQVAYQLDLDPQGVQSLRRKLGLPKLPRGRPPGQLSGRYTRELPYVIGVRQPLYEGLLFTAEEERRLDAFLDAHCPGWRKEIFSVWLR